MKCPRCSAEVSGRFCGFCGGALEPRRCPACAAEVSPGHRFCQECGAEQGETAPVAAEAPAARAADQAGQGGTTRWWIGGIVGAATVVLLGLPYVASSRSSGAELARMPMAPGVGAGGAAGVDLSTMSPREAADRLFNRVMAALSAGDTGEVQTFLPMAIDAYGMVPELDADGLFHLSLLQQAAGNHEAGLLSAQGILGPAPDHILGLYAAGEAARELGETEMAMGYFRRILEVFEAESARGLPEYVEHAGFLPTVRETARAFVAPGGD
jgi:tetratricopeptide (TPR) repeat protein